MKIFIRLGRLDFLNYSTHHYLSLNGKPWEMHNHTGISVHMPSFSAFVICIKDKVFTFQTFKQNSTCHRCRVFIYRGQNTGIRIGNSFFFCKIQPFRKLNNRIGVQIAFLNGSPSYSSRISSSCFVKSLTLQLFIFANLLAMEKSSINHLQ